MGVLGGKYHAVVTLLRRYRQETRRLADGGAAQDFGPSSMFCEQATMHRLLAETQGGAGAESNLRQFRLFWGAPFTSAFKMFESPRVHDNIYYIYHK